MGQKGGPGRKCKRRGLDVASIKKEGGVIAWHPRSVMCFVVAVGSYLELRSLLLEGCIGAAIAWRSQPVPLCRRGAAVIRGAFLHPRETGLYEEVRAGMWS